MVIAVDFDGTIVEHRYPSIGREIPFAIDTLKKLSSERHKLILWSVREGKLLDEAVAFCRERGLEFYAVNRDYPEEEKNLNNHFSRKLKADVFIDDRNLGGLPDWGMIYGKTEKFLCTLIREIETYFYNIIILAKKTSNKYENQKISLSIGYSFGAGRLYFL